MPDFKTLREMYPEFLYKSYDIEKTAEEIVLTFHFSFGEHSFAPQTRIKTENLDIINAFDAPAAKSMVFYLGMVEAVSYWKAACPPKVRVLCGEVDDSAALWFKKLWFSGLGEFFYRNNIETDFESFVEIIGEGEAHQKSEFISSGLNLIPVGGGKDSAVTAELLKPFSEKNMFFTVNDQPARSECVAAAGYEAGRIIRTYRTIDKHLLELNRLGYLNGHTPFSAIVAFLSFYCAYLIGAQNIVLSNESSANESNVGNLSVNHQYSKSFEFENDFKEFSAARLADGIHYFSLLRPFNEAQIAKMFASFPQYFEVFKSCNVGSKKNIWCGNCAKCLFVFIMLSPFVDRAELERIFGGNMLDKAELKADFDGLCGISGVKPFECVGTASEVCAMLELTIKKYGDGSLPALLAEYKARRSPYPNEKIKSLFGEFNDINLIPAEFIPAVRRMHKYVSTVD